MIDSVEVEISYASELCGLRFGLGLTTCSLLESLFSLLRQGAYHSVLGEVELAHPGFNYAFSIAMRCFVVSTTEEVKKALEKERRKRMLSTIPETARVVLGEYLAKSEQWQLIRTSYRTKSCLNMWATIIQIAQRSQDH